jgi:hypothetical protein
MEEESRNRKCGKKMLEFGCLKIRKDVNLMGD